MCKAIMYFSNGDTLTVHEDELLIPIVRAEHDNKVFASMSKPIHLENHIQNGLIPSIISTFCICDFFYVSPNYEIAYNKNSIVKIETY